VDNDGNALLTGALYWNTTSSEMRVYSGSAWITSYLPAAAYLALAGGTMTGAITFAAGQFGTNVNTFLSTPSSANLAAALTDETGSGAAVFANTPTLIAPILGTPTSGTLTNCTFPTLNQNTTGTAAGLSTTLSIASGGTNSTATPTAGGAGYGTGTQHAYTPAGTAGQVLTSAGTSAPTWANPAGGGSLVFISSITASAASTVSFTSGINSTYDDYIVEISDLSFAVSSQLIYMISENNGSSYLATNYFNNENYIYAGTLGGRQANNAYGSVTNNTYLVNTVASNHISFRLCNVNATSTKKQFVTSASLASGGGAVRDLTNSCYTPSTGSINAIKFYADNYATITGTFRLYGVKKS
jgi:hypothetical protein